MQSYFLLNKKIFCYNIYSMKIKEFFNDKNNILIVIFFIIGVLSRVMFIDKFPVGLNVDEASAGYESYSIMNYGIDRNGKSFPVYLIAWGSGQNALYTYLLIPFIFLFGLNVFAVRLPMAILGCISLFILYNTLNEYNKKIATIGLGFLAICPWHIMKCRWGLESNLFPDLVLISTCLILHFVKTNKSRYLYIATILFSLSAYSYAISWIFLPLFLIITFIYMIAKKYITIEKALICMLICLILVLPLIIFFIINYFNLPEMKIGKITIPKLYGARFNEVLPENGNILFQYLKNFIYNMKIIISQKDHGFYNSLPFFGITYLISWPITLIGIYNCFRKRNFEKNILNIWFICALIILFVISYGNINKLNIIMFPLVLYTMVGIYCIIKKFNKLYVNVIIFIMYFILYILFGISYICVERENPLVCKGLEEPLKYVESLEKREKNIYYNFREPYIFVLFYNKVPVYEYISSVEYIYYLEELQEYMYYTNVKRVGEYDFSMSHNLNDKDAVYIVPKYFEYNVSLYNVKEFDNFYVLTLK